MITKTSATITNLKNLFIEMFLDKTAKVSNVADGSVVNATAFGVAKVAQKAMKDIAIKEAQIFPDTATGVYLDKAAALYGVSPRKGALGSSTYIRVSADPGTVYDTTVTFVSKNGIRFQVDESLTVGESGYGYVKVRSVNAGYTTNVAPNSITNVNPQPQGHIECTNEYYAIGGRDSEDDETFRIRIKNNLNVLSKNTVEYWTQVLNGIDDRVLKVMAAGLNEQGIYNLYIVSQNGIFFTEDELGTLLEQVQGYFSLSDLNIEGKAVGISLKNIDWFYVGSERGLDFRVQLQSDYDVATVRQNIQVNLTKYLDFRFWTPGDVVEWDDLLDIVKKTEGVKYVPDEYFFPYYDQQVPANQLPRIKGFIMRDQDGDILYDSDSNLSPLFYPAESEDLFVGINDSSLNLYQTAFFNVKDSDGNPVEGVNISIGNNGISTNEQGQASLQLANGQYSYIASLQGYIPVEGTFVVLNGSVSIDVEMVRVPYTVTFRVRDERGAVVPYANVTMDNRTTTTNIEGVATLSARNGNYPYLILKLGYDDYSDNVVVQDGNAQVNVEMEFTVWTITVIVKDTENVPIVNAVVNVNNGQYLTNQQGEAEIPLVNGQYPVTIEKAGYDTLNGSITVNNSNADVTFELDYFLYDVLFNIYQVNQGTPAEGALVTIQGQPSALPVNSLGQATTKLKNGEYNYTITKRGYDDLTGSFNVRGQNVNVERTLDLKHYNVVITVLDSDNNEPVQGAAVNINSSSYPTNDKGQVTVSLQNGTYSYTVTKSGYYDGNSSVTVLDSDNSSVVNLQARLYNVIMSVRDPERQSIENATVTINNNTYQTQSNGQVSLQLKNGIYPFTVTATGMEDYSDDLTVASADIPLLGISMEYRKYNITFAVTTDEGIAVGNANIHINDNDYQTSQGGLVTIPLSNGTYPYTVAKVGYVPTESSVTVLNADKNVAVTVTVMSYDVTFVVKDNMASPNLLQDVEIQISGREDTLTTNASGEATVSLKTGSYAATFIKDGYKGEELSFEVSGEETFIQILKKIWNLSFKVSAAEKTVLQGVTINVSGEALVGGSTTLTTKEDGTTDPVQVINGAYDWNASLTGYSPEEGVGSINDADEIKEVELTYGFETTFTVKDNLGSPVDGVQIVVDGSETLTTANGGIATTNLSTGTHTYTYSKDGYVSGSGTVQIEEAEKSVDITINVGAVVTFHTTAKSGNLANVKIVISQATKAGKAKVRALPETIVTNQQGIATISLPSGNYVYFIPTSETDNTDLIDVPDGTFQVGVEAKTLELDLSDYLKYTIKFQTIPSVSGVNITLNRESAQVGTGSTNGSGAIEFKNRNGEYTYTATKTGYVDLSGSFTVNDGMQTVTLNMQQISTVTFTVKKEIDSSLIQNAVVEMVDQLDPSNKYKGTTNSSGVATMTYAGGDFEWSQDDDADYSGMFVLPENETYIIPSGGVPGDQMKTYFPNGVVCSPLAIVTDGGSNEENLMSAINSYKIDGWNGSWDLKKRNFTLTGVKKEGTPTVTNSYAVLSVDAGFLFKMVDNIMIAPLVNINYNKALDFGVKVSGVPENLKIVANWGSIESSKTVPLTNGTIQRIQLSDLIFDVEEFIKSTTFALALESADEGSLSTDDIKSLNITISFYGKKFTSTEVPENKVLYGNYNYTMTPPSPYETQSGVLNVNTPAINKELLVANNTEVTFKVTAKQPLLTRPQIGDFVYGDKTWSTELDGTKTCVGVITDVRSKDFDFIALRDGDMAVWAQTLDIIPIALLPLPNSAIPIENALVKMTSASNNCQQNTNNNGEAVISAVLGVDYGYEVSADGYATQNGKVGVLNEAKTIEVTLQPASELTVVVHRNTLDGATDISGVQVVVTENKEGGVQMASGTTSQNGTVVLFVPDGSYKVAFSKDGFESKEETVEVNGKTALNTFLLQIYNTINVQVRRVGQMQGMPSQIQLKDSTGLEVIQTKNITTTVTFANVAYGQYILYVPEGDFSKETSQSITVNSEGMQVQVNLTPLYMVQVKVNPTGGNVKFTDSEGQKHTGSAGPATYTARFDKIPAGNYQIKITSSGFSDFSTTGSISGVYQTSVNLKYTLTKPNKLVQITSDQPNYRLDTSYKYISLLIVGRGGEKSENWSSWDRFVLMGGTTGQIVYIPNILISDISNGRINKITFSGVPNVSGWKEGTEYSITLGQTTYEYVAYNGVSNASNDSFVTMPQRSNLSNYSVYNAKSSGAIAAHLAGVFYCSGSFGSQNAKEQTYSFTGPRMQPDGAPGGDGRYGFKSSYERTIVGEKTRPIQSSVTIPIQSIFGGISKGKAGYLNTESGSRTGASAYGGAGYGGSYFTSPDGGKTRIAGYGSGQTASPADDDAGNILMPGEGIFCIYYHNEPI